MTIYNRFVKCCLLCVVAALVGACGQNASDPGENQAAPKPPIVNDSRADLVLAYESPDGPQVASRVADVPEEQRAAVRVQDPTVPPESRDPGWVFVADLRTKGPGGDYAVQVVRREAYEAQREASRPKPAVEESAPASNEPSAGQAPRPSLGLPPGVRVVMYATKHCPVCVKARRWLLDQGIPYVERDVESDAAAASELSTKGRAQGVPTNGVPVFEVDGKLVPGFEPAMILKLWGAKISA